MNRDELIVRHDLGAAVAAVNLVDCRLSFHEQRLTGDVWYVATGPRGAFALPAIRKDVLLRVRHGWSVAQPSAHRRARSHYARWQRVTISDDLSVALRARGNSLQMGYLFANGVPFGGGGGALPTMRRANLIERVQMWLSGQRGSGVEYAVRNRINRDGEKERVI